MESCSLQANKDQILPNTWFGRKGSISLGVARTASKKQARLTHVKTTSNTGTLEGLVLSVLPAGLHETRHLILGELDLAATESGQRDIGKL